MATGIEMYTALRQATRQICAGGEFTINAVEEYDLRKLRPSDLVALGFDQTIAEEVSSSLLNGDCGPLAHRMGLRLLVRHDAPRLLPENPAEPGAAAEGGGM